MKNGPTERLQIMLTSGIRYRKVVLFGLPNIPRSCLSNFWVSKFEYNQKTRAEKKEWARRF